MDVLCASKGLPPVYCLAKLIQLPFHKLNLKLDFNEKFSKLRFIELMNEYGMYSIVRDDLDDWIELFEME